MPNGEARPLAGSFLGGPLGLALRGLCGPSGQSRPQAWRSVGKALFQGSSVSDHVFPQWEGDAGLGGLSDLACVCRSGCERRCSENVLGKKGFSMLVQKVFRSSPTDSDVMARTKWSFTWRMNCLLGCSKEKDGESQGVLLALE